MQQCRVFGLQKASHFRIAEKPKTRKQNVISSTIFGCQLRGGVFLFSFPLLLDGTARVRVECAVLVFDDRAPTRNAAMAS
jgi:hypothetical protein